MTLMQEDSEEQLRTYRKSEFDASATIVLNTNKYGRGSPKGEPNERRDGYSFYELEEKNGKRCTSYITSRMVNSPLLTAVTDRQYENWKKKTIIGRSATFTWSEVIIGKSNRFIKVHMWNIRDLA